jgi:hypothetical protein
MQTSVRVGYWASRNNMKEYRIYAIVIWMFDPIFVNNLQPALDDNLWPTEPKNQNYKTRLLYQVQYLLGMNTINPNSLVEASPKNWPENENDTNDDEYELFILKYDGNQDKLVE